MEVVSVRMKMPRELKAKWIWEVVARDSGEGNRWRVKSGVKSMPGTWLILGDRLCFTV
jgi:hypothetical protein